MGDPQPPTASQPERHRYIRVMILAKRNSAMTETQFNEYWSTTHAQKASAHLAKFGIVGYKQYHTPSSMRQQLISALPVLGLDAESDMFAGYDGYCELLMPDLQCYQKAIADEYYQKVIAPDERVFADWSGSKITVGWEEVYILDGKVVNLEGA